MGRYTTVQAYADNNANMRSVSYEQATGSSEAKGGVVKPEKVNNPYGSTAGAGSGEFHVYRHARAREMERLRHLDDDEREKIMDEQFATTVAQYKEEGERKTSQRRKKRQRYKEAKMRKKNLQKSGIHLMGDDDEAGDDSNEDEFSYEHDAKIVGNGDGAEQKLDGNNSLTPTVSNSEAKTSGSVGVQELHVNNESPRIETSQPWLQQPDNEEEGGEPEGSPPTKKQARDDLVTKDAVVS